jgi:UDP-glucose 4-epimerase
VAILVTGGAGYIGAHVVRALGERGDEVVVVDDLSAGSAERIPGIRLERIDLAAPGAATLVAGVLRDSGADGIIHLAARKRVDESVARPTWYHAQNGGGMLAVLDAAADAGVERMVFSSTAAVYASSDTPVTEDSPTVPVNPYGETKLVGEWMLRAQTVATGLQGVSLRYFNVAGAVSPELADTAGGNVFPMVLERIEAGEPPMVFGDDYPTPDGTCVRDYIHVADVAAAHLAALDALADGPAYRVYNIGTGEGTSVRTLVDALLAAAGSDLRPVIAPRRAGDPAVVVADATRIRTELGWRPQHDLADIVASAWAAAQGA